MWVVPALLALTYPLVFLIEGGTWERRLLRSAFSVLAPAAGITVLCLLDRADPDDAQRPRALFWAAMALLSPAVLVVAYVVLLRSGVTTQGPLWRSLSVALVALGAGGWTAVRRAPRARPTPQALLKVHRITASLLLLFAVFHLGNHATAFWSLAFNLALFEVLRSVYRGRVLDPLMVAVVGAQVVTGVMLFASAVSRRGTWVDRLQAYSGLYLAIFLAVHTVAIVFLVPGGTDFPRATGGRRGSLGTFWLLYYALGPMAFFTHAACAVSRISSLTRPRLGLLLSRSTAAVGVAVCLAITLALLGVRIQDGAGRPAPPPASALALPPR